MIQIKMGNQLKQDQTTLGDLPPNATFVFHEEDGDYRISTVFRKIVRPPGKAPKGKKSNDKCWVTDLGDGFESEQVAEAIVRRVDVEATWTFADKE